MKSAKQKSSGIPKTPTNHAKWSYLLLVNDPDVSDLPSDYNRFDVDGIQNALASDSDYFAVITHPKEARIPQIGSLQNHTSKAWLCTDFKKTSLLNQVIKGWDEAKERGHLLVFNKKALQHLSDTDFKAENIAELYYLTQKATLETEIVYGKQDIKKSTHWAQAKKIGLSRWFQYFFSKHQTPFKTAFLFVALLGLIFMTSVSQKAGISGDEFVQHEYGKVIASYQLKKIGVHLPIDTNALKGQKMNTLAAAYSEEGANIATLEDPDRLMHLYGSSFDTFCAILIHFLQIEDYMEFRHFWNALLGWLIVVYGALILRRLVKGSWLWATLAFVLLFFTPRIFGEALNNPKDIPFALGYIMSIYYALKLFSSFPSYRSWDLVGLVFGIGLGISIRIGGLLTIAIIGVYMGLKYIESIGFKSFYSLKWKNFSRWILFFLGSAVTAYIIGIYVWPYGWQSPIDNPLKALSAFTDYQVSLRQLFDGVLYDSDQLPSYYLAKYIWITLPVGIILGFFVYLITTVLKRKAFTSEEFLLLFCAIFPIFYIYIKDSSVYGGLRHILFTLPGFIILSTLGLYKLAAYLPKPQWTGSLLALLPAILPASFIVKNQNLSYIYFNETIGGIKGAYGLYELDYYLASLKPSSDYIIENVVKKDPEKKITVVSYGMDQVTYYLRKFPNIKVGFTRFDDRADKPWDYAIFYNAYMDKHRLKNNYYPPIGTIFAPQIDGKAVGCVVKRPNTTDLEGLTALNQESNPEKAISLFKSYLLQDSTSSEVWFHLASSYANLGQLDSALFFAHKSSHVFKENSRAIFLKYQLYMQKNMAKNAVEVMDDYILSRPKDPDGYIMKSQALMVNKEYYRAIESVQKALPFNPFDDRIYKIGAQCYQNLKDQTNTQLWYSAALFKQATNAQEQNNSIQSIQKIYANATGEELDLSKYFK
jgi:tetratricopeptide (TPR) repeat protein